MIALAQGLVHLLFPKPARQRETAQPHDKSKSEPEAQSCFSWHRACCSAKLRQRAGGMDFHFAGVVLSNKTPILLRGGANSPHAARSHRSVVCRSSSAAGRDNDPPLFWWDRHPLAFGGIFHTPFGGIITLAPRPAGYRPTRLSAGSAPSRLRRGFSHAFWRHHYPHASFSGIATHTPFSGICTLTLSARFFHPSFGGIITLTP